LWQFTTLMKQSRKYHSWTNYVKQSNETERKSIKCLLWYSHRHRHSGDPWCRAPIVTQTRLNLSQTLTKDSTRRQMWFFIPDGTIDMVTIQSPSGVKFLSSIITRHIEPRAWVAIMCKMCCLRRSYLEISAKLSVCLLVWNSALSGLNFGWLCDRWLWCRLTEVFCSLASYLRIVTKRDCCLRLVSHWPAVAEGHAHTASSDFFQRGFK